MSKRVILGISGASGAALGLSVAQQLNDMGAELDLVISPAAERTLTEECGAGALATVKDFANTCHDIRNIGASIASGSVPLAGMIVAPSSMRSLAAISNGLDDNLLTRAAGVQLKERRRLVLLAREAPLTLAHLRNMTSVTEMGAIVMPPVPAFYLRPDSVDAIVTQIAARAIDLLGMGNPQAQAWSEI
ncbi:UbiX family flavin prenyltransferase [Aliiroseovarius sp. KMU-50]|uniref:Flavin prenyltransferase UbiX n=1 Tax=Aliiroseovarius salicola TaxID=3009082 RepID=A0ABT4VZS1_9RHOB|nr:UbiX family flavin prenyltransferase [Aliiroseovarius sp. KMU-50]MDA5093761.1 UbiX family flavin prenyltransferase [Aliiroseovarius sp. KMU-50]